MPLQQVHLPLSLSHSTQQQHGAQDADVLSPWYVYQLYLFFFFYSAESAPFYLTSILTVIIATLYMFFSPANEGCTSTCMKMAQTMLSLGQPEVWSFFQLYLLTNFFLDSGFFWLQLTMNVPKHAQT